MTTKPYAFQEKGVRKIEHFDGRALLADQMGLGKTLQSLLWMKKAKAIPTIVICPASLKWNWQREALHHLGLQSDVLEGTKPKKKGINKPKLTILNYDIIGPWIPYLKSLKPKLIILDECHFCKSRKAQRTKNARDLCEGIPHVIALSGTPLTNRPAELWPTLNIIRPDIYPAFTPFALKHCKPRRTHWGWEFKGAENLDLLHNNLNRYMMIRRLKRDVLLDLPEKSRHVVVVPLENRREYDEAKRDLVAWIRKTKGAGKARRAARAERLVRMGYLKRLAATSKLPAVFQWIDDFLEETDDKLVMFGIHHAVLQPLHARYVNSVLVDGKLAKRKRMNAVDQFQKDRKTRIFFGNVMAAGVGLNLTRAPTMAFAEIGWTPGEHEQAEDRLHRIGQTRGVSCYYLIGHDTIEDYLCELIQKKQKVLDATLDGNGAETGSLDIYDQLERELLKR